MILLSKKAWKSSASESRESWAGRVLTGLADVSLSVIQIYLSLVTFFDLSIVVVFLSRLQVLVIVFTMIVKDVDPCQLLSQTFSSSFPSDAFPFSLLLDCHTRECVGIMMTLLEWREEDRLASNKQTNIHIYTLYKYILFEHT